MTLRAFTVTFLFLVTLFFSTAAFAIDENQVIDPKGTVVEEASDADPMGDIFTGQTSSVGIVITILGYILILGGLGIAIWMLFKRGLLRKPFANKEGKLKVAETRMLGNRQFIMVVEYEDQKILLGVGPGKIDYLTNLSGHSSSFPSIGAEQVSEGNA